MWISNLFWLSQHLKYVFDPCVISTIPIDVGGICAARNSVPTRRGLPGPGHCSCLQIYPGIEYINLIFDPLRMDLNFVQGSYLPNQDI